MSHLKTFAIRVVPPCGKPWAARSKPNLEKETCLQGQDFNMRWKHWGNWRMFLYLPFLHPSKAPQPPEPRGSKSCSGGRGFPAYAMHPLRRSLLQRLVRLPLFSYYHFTARTIYSGPAEGSAESFPAYVMHTILNKKFTSVVGISLQAWILKGSSAPSEISKPLTPETLPPSKVPKNEQASYTFHAYLQGYLRPANVGHLMTKLNTHRINLT